MKELKLKNKIFDHNPEIINLNILSNQLLENNDIQFLQSIKKELYHDFITQQIFRTRTEAEISVLNDYKFPTPDAKYWQAVRENMGHFQELVHLSFQFKRDIINLEIKKREYEQEKDYLKKQLIAVDIEELEWKILWHKRIAKARIEELKQWHEIKYNLLKQGLIAGINDPNDHQILSWSYRFLNQYKAAIKSKGTSQSEMQNIEGLLVTAIRHLKQRNLYNKFLNLLNQHDRKFLRKIEDRI